MTVHVCVYDVHMLMQVSAAGGARGVPRGCLVCAQDGIEAQLGQSVQNTHSLTKTCHTCPIKSKPKQRDSLESNSTQECHQDILSNTQHAIEHNINEQCMNISENASIHDQNATRGQHRYTKYIFIYLRFVCVYNKKEKYIEC